MEVRSTNHGNSFGRHYWPFRSKHYLLHVFCYAVFAQELVRLHLIVHLGSVDKWSLKVKAVDLQRSLLGVILIQAEGDCCNWRELVNKVIKKMSLFFTDWFRKTRYIPNDSTTFFRRLVSTDSPFLWRSINCRTAAITFRSTWLKRLSFQLTRAS